MSMLWSFLDNMTLDNKASRRRRARLKGKHGGKRGCRARFRRGLAAELLEPRRMLAFTATVMIDSATLRADVVFDEDLTMPGNDTLILSLDALGNLMHNRATAGDTAFDSNLDLQTGDGADTTSLNINLIQSITVNVGQLNDADLIVIQGLAATEITDLTINGDLKDVVSFEIPATGATTDLQGGNLKVAGVQTIAIDAPITTSGGGIIDLSANLMDVAQPIRGAATLHLQPTTPGTSVGIGGGVGTLNLDDAELDNLFDGFNLIVIGNPTSGDITLLTTIFKDNLGLLTSGAVVTSDGTDIFNEGNTTVIDGAVEPGGSGSDEFGQFNIDGLLTFGQRSSLNLTLLDITTAGVTYDQVVVQGSRRETNFANTTLNLTLHPAFAANVGDEFILVDNEEPFSTFAGSLFDGFGEGADVILGNNFFSITYRGGPDGNDVILKHGGFLNNPPTANDDTFVVDEDSGTTNLNVLANDSIAPDEDELLTITSTGAGSAGGMVTIVGGVSIDYKPATDFSGTETFTYTIDDGDTSSTDTATVTINVTAVNDEPSFTKGADETVLEDAGAQTVNGWATALSKGPADEVTQTLSFNITGNSNPGLFSAPPTVNANGDLTYTLAVDANGSAVVTLNIMDNGGTTNGGDDTSPDQTFTINVTAVNDEPSFTKGADETVLEDAVAQTVNGWATALSNGPADEVTQTLSFNITGNSNPGLFSAPPTVNANGDLTYTLAVDANGSAVVTLNIMDNGGTTNGGDDTSPDQTFTINVTAVNDEPSFTKGADETVLEDAVAQTVNGWATALSNGPASEVTQTLSFNITGNSNPSLFSAPPTVNANGDLTYTPATDANGSAVVTLNIMDNGGTTTGGDDTSPDQTFTINVTAVNDEPSFTKGADETVLEDAGAQTINGWATALSKGPADEVAQTLSFNITGNSNPGLFSAPPTVNANGDLTYTPAADANGSAVVTLNIMDNGGTTNGGDDTSPDQTFTINVTAVNDEPSFTKGADETVLEDAVAQTVNGWATALSNGPASEVTQTLSFNITGNSNPSLFSAPPTVNANGDLTYTPATDANGSAVVTLNIMDNGGTTTGGDDTSPDQTFTINVTAVNDEPSFTKGADETVLEDAGAQTINGWATALSKGPADEVAQTLSFNITGNSNPGLFSAPPTVNANGDLTYTPAADANGSAVVTLNIMDNGGTTNGGGDTSPDQTFTINVTAVNDEPSFTKGADETVLEDAGAQTVNGWATALSKGPADEVTQTLSFNITGNSNPGLFSAPPTVNANGDLAYTPAADANGSAVVTLNIIDNGGTTNGGDDTSPDQTFTINVTSINDPPVTTDDEYNVDEDNTLNATSVLTNDVDTHGGAPNEDNVPLTARLVSGPANATNFSFSDNGTFTYTPADNFNGNDTFIYESLDSLNGVSIGTAVISVTSINDAPIFTLGFDPAVKASNGSTVVTGFVTAIFPGQQSPPDEAGQTLEFELTTTGSLAFVADGQPRIELQNSDPSTGNLLFETVAGSHGCATIDAKLTDNGGTADTGVDESMQTFELCAALTSVQTIENPETGAIDIHVVDLLPGGKPDRLKLALDANGDLVVTDLDYAVIDLTSNPPQISNGTVVSLGTDVSLTIDLMGGDDTLEIDFSNSPFGALDRSITINGGSGIDVLTISGMVPLGSGSFTAGETASATDPSKNDLESILVNAMISATDVTLTAQLNLELNSGIVTRNLGNVRLTAVEHDILGGNCAMIDADGQLVNLHGTTGIAGVTILNPSGTVTLTSSGGAIVGCEAAVSVTADTLVLDAATSIGAALFEDGQLTDVRPLQTNVAKLSIQAQGLGVFIANDGPVEILQAPDSTSLLGGVHIWPLGDGEARRISIGVIATPAWKNARNSFDVNDDSIVSPFDVLVATNFLNGSGPGKLPAQFTPDALYLDVNGDGSNSASDILQVINFLNRMDFAMAEGESLVPTLTDPSEFPWWAGPAGDTSDRLNWSAGADERDDDVKQASRQHAAVVTTRLAVWSEHDRHVESHADEVADELELMISEIATEIVRTLNSGD